jgi:hypothetical protein
MDGFLQFAIRKNRLEHVTSTWGQRLKPQSPVWSQLKSQKRKAIEPQQDRKVAVSPVPPAKPVEQDIAKPVQQDIAKPVKSVQPAKHPVEQDKAVSPVQPAKPVEQDIAKPVKHVERTAPLDPQWSKKYTVFKGNRIHGNKLDRWLKRRLQHRRSRDVAFLLRGPSGSGKTILLNQYARENNLAVHSFGPGELSTIEDIENRFKPAVFCNGFKPSLVVVDGIAHIKNFTAVIKILEELHGGTTKKKIVHAKPSNPLVFIGDNVYDRKFTQLAKYCTVVKLFPATVSVMTTLMRHVLKTEDKSFSNLSAMVTRSNGDVRFMLNQAQLSLLLVDGAINEQETVDSSYNDIFAVVKSLSSCVRDLLVECGRAYDVHGFLLTSMVFSNYIQMSQNFEDVVTSIDDLAAFDLLDLSEYKSAGLSNVFLRSEAPTRVSTDNKKYTSNKRFEEVLFIASTMRRCSQMSMLDELGIISGGRLSECYGGDSHLFRIDSGDCCYAYGVAHDIPAKAVRGMHKLLINGSTF